MKDSMRISIAFDADDTLWVERALFSGSGKTILHITLKLSPTFRIARTV